MTSKFNLNQRIQQLEQEQDTLYGKILEYFYVTNFDISMWINQAEKILDEKKAEIERKKK